MNKYMNTRELSKYLDINEKKIYSLITEKKLPATKITGKWIFLKELVDMWIENSIESIPQRVEKLKNVLLVSGSNDPLLELLINGMNKATRDVSSFFSITGSLGGLLTLKDNQTHICGCHLLDAQAQEYNLPFIASYVPNREIVVVNFVFRKQGLIIRKDNPSKISAIEDLWRQDVMFINRQRGSGTRLLLDNYLEKVGVSPSKINGYDKECDTHFEVGISVLKGTVNVGIGVESVANRLGLGFIPIREERFDLLVPRDYFFIKEVQIFLDILRSDQFKKRAQSLSGYDTRDSGKIISGN